MNATKGDKQGPNHGVRRCSSDRAHSSTDDSAIHRKQMGKFGEFSGNVTESYGAVMSRPLAVPGIQESSGTHGEAIAAVGIADFEDWAGLGTGFGAQAFLV